ncbi:hydroxyacid dehydrogenase [Corynebacterium diphtheriae]|nr:putative DNA-binding protein [Corynebacterium diphtheriae]CAB0639982.1 hydroxyacid dehydrogenase [Corynebacterium diphtheriae]CAB0926636.1 hydroxyacid dehydrogenase [Corynebacterium diphtheriae]CAB0993320.1 hydroxyacid dehydrogenase [Corynebacterium diphtheriae]
MKTQLTNPSQIAIYTTEDGAAHVRLQLKQGTAWLTQKQMAELFDVGVSAISKHLKTIYTDGELSREATISKMENVALEQGRTVRRRIEHYNLEAILAVGYRVRGPRGSQFRKWATEVLTEYLIKGFAMDDKRLKNDGTDTHFDELLERIREIRASERQFFRKICDVIAKTSDDYEEKKSYTEVRNFFAGIQNRLHYATHHHTAAQIIFKRADHRKANAGLTTWAGEVPHKSDMMVAKNFLTDDELRRMNRLTTMFLDYAEDQAERRKTLLLKDWMAKTDAWLVFNDRDVLQGFGDRSHKQAVNKAKSEWDKYQGVIDQGVNELDMKQLEQEVKELSRGENPID